MTSVKVSGSMSAEQIQAAANLVKAQQYGSATGNCAAAAVAIVLLLLAFRCNDVTLWDLKTRDCKPAALSAEGAP